MLRVLTACRHRRSVFNQHGLSCRQITEGVWKSPEDLISQSQKRAEDHSSDLDILNSPPLSLSGLSDLSTSSSLANWMPVSAGDGDTSGSEQEAQPPMALRNRVLDELPGRRPGDKCLSAEVRLVRSRVSPAYNRKNVSRRKGK